VIGLSREFQQAARLVAAGVKAASFPINETRARVRDGAERVIGRMPKESGRISVHRDGMINGWRPLGSARAWTSIASLSAATTGRYIIPRRCLTSCHETFEAGERFRIARLTDGPTCAASASDG
jgi:hypothetical protein